jgi:gamma-glutamyltranspeptidase/glutathione hydrolase
MTLKDKLMLHMKCTKKLVRIHAFILLATVLVLIVLSCEAGIGTLPEVIVPSSDPVYTSYGFGVSASHPLAVEAGMKVMRNGGNAVDAAVAVAYTLGVVEPYASGIGGGGTLLIHPAGSLEPLAYDYREYMPKSGQMPSGHVGVPGFVKGMDVVLDDFGVAAREVVFEPAIFYAREGFKADEYLVERITASRRRLPVSKLHQFYPGGMPVAPGNIIQQEQLAETIELIRDAGAEEFYNGLLYEEVSAQVTGLDLIDFTDYVVKRTLPVKGQFADYDIYSAPAPLSGITLVQTMQVSEFAGIEQVYGTQDYIPLMIDILKKTYSERIRHVGDPDFIDLDIDFLTSREYAKQISNDLIRNAII